MGEVFNAISGRLSSSFSIDLNEYIHRDSKGTTLKENDTTLGGISFVAQNKNGAVGAADLKAAFDSAVDYAGRRAFAGQIRVEDLANEFLQLSFGKTDGLGFREIFYLPQLPRRAGLPAPTPVYDRSARVFDLKFGKIVDAPPQTSLHASLPDESSAKRRNSGDETPLCKIHLDDKGFLYADRDGMVYTSLTDAVHHLGDELLLKDILIGENSRLSFFFYTTGDSINELNLQIDPYNHNAFLRNDPARAITGLELTAPGRVRLPASTSYSRVEFFLRGSLGTTIDPLPKSFELAGTLGARFIW